MKRKLEAEVMDSAQEAASYDQMDHCEANDAFVERLIELGAGGRMLDIGTGPGHIPLLVCERIPQSRVFGVDLSLEMLKIARQRLENSPFEDRIEFHMIDAKALAFPDGSFDTVFSNTILHHLPDPQIFISEAWRVLKVGGVLLIRDLYRPEDRQTLDALVEKHAGEANENQRKMFGDSLNAALTPKELGNLIYQLEITSTNIVLDTDRHMSLQTSSAKK